MAKHHGSPALNKDLNGVFILFAALLALDFMLLFQFTMNMFYPWHNYADFGWVFMWIYFGIPYLAPLCAFIAAFFASPRLMRANGNMNSIMILVNIPLTFIAHLKNDGNDLAFLLTLGLMVMVKILQSIVGAKIRMYMINPRYSQNRRKILKLQALQKQKIQNREAILGRSANL